MITLTKNKIYRSPYSLKKTKPDSEKVKELTTGNIIFYLGEDVEFGEDLTFRQLFDIIIYHKEFFNILFNSEMNGLNIEDFISDYEKDILPESANGDYKIIFTWICEIYDFENKVEYYDGVAFDGLGKLNSDDKQEYPIRLIFTSLSEYKDKLIIADNTFEIQNRKSYENEIEAAFKANYRPFNLYGVISGILREISCYGNPEQKEKIRKEIERNQNEIREWIEEGNIDEHMKSEEDVLEELGDEDFEEVFEEVGEQTFWDVLYPKEEPNKIEKDEVNGALILLSEISDVPLEQQLKEAHDAEDYRKAAKIKKLIDRRNKNK